MHLILDIWYFIIEISQIKWSYCFEELMLLSKLIGIKYLFVHSSWAETGYQIHVFNFFIRSLKNWGQLINSKIDIFLVIKKKFNKYDKQTITGKLPFGTDSMKWHCSEEKCPAAKFQQIPGELYDNKLILHILSAEIFCLSKRVLT